MSDVTAPAQPRTPGRAVMARQYGSAIRNCVAASVLLLLLAGCSGGQGAASPTVGTSTGTATAAPSSAPAASTAATALTTASSSSANGPGNAAAQTGAAPTFSAATAARKATVESTLRALLGGTAIPEQQILRAALAAAGIPAQDLEVSVSRTPTGLDVDAIEAAAKSGNDCVIGQIRDGNVSMTVLPVLASGKCFVGDSR